jgi:hypothetical protein
VCNPKVDPPKISVRELPQRPRGLSGDVMKNHV